MSDEKPAPEIQINVKGPNELKLQISITTDKTVLELKQAIAEKSDVEADRQRLIYSGRVLKDEELLSVYKIQSSHTIHMVKGAARSNNSSSGSSSTPQPLPTMQAGQNPHDPLTQLNSHMGFGAMAGLNPFADMGLNPNDPNMMQGMMNSPQFMQQMSSLLSNPAIMEQVINSNPHLQGMGPQVREALNSEAFRNMVSNPDSLRQMFQMASMFNGAGPGMGGPAAPNFPAPGVPGSTPSSTSSSTPSAGSTTGSTPAAGTTPPPFNPFGLWGALAGANAGAGAGAGAQGQGGAGALPPFDPAALQNMMAAFGGAGIGGGGAGGAGGGLFGAPNPTPSDTRPPEERFQVQLQQLQDMGFTNASQNVRALLATGGNVHSAIEYILNGGGL